MKIRAYKTFKKVYRKLPADIQDKIDKQIDILAGDFRHPCGSIFKIEPAFKR